MNKKLLRALSVTTLGLALVACGGTESSASSNTGSSAGTSGTSASVSEVAKSIRLKSTATSVKDAGEKVVETKQELHDRYGMSNAEQGEWWVQENAYEAFTKDKTIATVTGTTVDAITGVSIKLDNFTGALNGITDSKAFTTSEAPKAGVGTIVSFEDNVLTVTVAGLAADGDKNVLATSINDYQIPVAISGDAVVIDTSKKQANADNIASKAANKSTECLSKRELGELYGMGGAEGTSGGSTAAEWNVQADAYATYAAGKKATELADKNYQTHYNPTGTEVVEGCTITMSSFGAAVAEAATLQSTIAPTAAADTAYTLKFGSFVSMNNSQIEVSTACVVLKGDNIVSSYFDVLQAPFVIE